MKKSTTLIKTTNDEISRVSINEIPVRFKDYPTNTEAQLFMLIEELNERVNVLEDKLNGKGTRHVR